MPWRKKNSVATRKRNGMIETPLKTQNKQKT